MEPNQNTGSFGVAIGGSDVLKEAFARRGIDASILSQVSPASAGGSPPIAPAPDITGTTGLPQAQAALAPQETQATKEPDSDMQTALKALVGVVKNEGDIKKSVIQMRQQGLT